MTAHLFPPFCFLDTPQNVTQYASQISPHFHIDIRYSPTVPHALHLWHNSEITTPTDFHF